MMSFFFEVDTPIGPATGRAHHNSGEVRTLEFDGGDNIELRINDRSEKQRLFQMVARLLSEHPEYHDEILKSDPGYDEQPARFTAADLGLTRHQVQY